MKEPKAKWLFTPVPSETHLKIKILAARQGTTMRQLVLDLIERELKRQEKKEGNGNDV